MHEFGEAADNSFAGKRSKLKLDMTNTALVSWREVFQRTLDCSGLHRREQNRKFDPCYPMEISSENLNGSYLLIKFIQQRMENSLKNNPLYQKLLEIIRIP